MLDYVITYFVGDTVEEKKIKCKKVLVRERSAIFVGNEVDDGRVLSVYPLEIVVSITLI